MKVEVLGSGCYKCIKLEALVNEMLLELGASGIEVVRVNDERQIRRYMPLDDTPGLMIDGTLVSTREVPERERLKRWLSVA